MVMPMMIAMEMGPSQTCTMENQPQMASNTSCLAWTLTITPLFTPLAFVFVLDPVQGAKTRFPPRLSPQQTHVKTAFH